MPETKNEDISPLQYIKGVGPVRAKALASAGLKTTGDLLYNIPRAYMDRDMVSSLKALSVQLRQEFVFNSDIFTNQFNISREVTVIATVHKKNLREYGRGKKMFVLYLTDSSGGEAKIIFWNYADYYNKVYTEGEWVVISGKPELNQAGKIEFSHPEIEKFDPEDQKLYVSGGILPIYKLPQALKNAKMNMRQLRLMVYYAMDTGLKALKETLTESLRNKYNLPDVKTSIRSLHFPETRDEIELATRRMKFEEIFYFELYLAIRQRGFKITENAPVIDPKSKSARKLYESLPFQLTGDQKKVIREISDDMKSGKPMNRLLQGDVGSGKTIVALLSMLVAVDNGYQVAMLAPTEILAEQHFTLVSNYLKDYDINIVQLVGGQKTKMRNSVTDKIKSGEANIIIGTHALFASEIEYHKLGLAIIDEQHRFGVAQRAELKKLAKKSFGDKDLSPHILVMSATPIPRTLSLTVYGDLDVSIIREMPKNRKPIISKVVFDSQIATVYNFIREEIKKGHQVYIVYPLVEKSEKLELKAATVHFERLKTEVFPDLKCGLIHGQMFWYEKEDAMKAFLNKEYDILVATTVIEVGIDVSNATVMLIENAERFGLSQLHQLRGRVGRGADQSYCMLVAKDNFKFQFNRKDIPEEERKAAVIRLKTMEETSDGFQISEVDLKLRGPGDVLGTRQSGLPGFKFIDLVSDGDLISLTRKEAFSIIEDDPQLRKSENQLLRAHILEQYSIGNNYFDIA